MNSMDSSSAGLTALQRVSNPVEPTASPIAAQLAGQVETLRQQLDQRTFELTAARHELERASRLKDEFLASMSHELRTPLNTILGMSESLQELVYGELNERQTRSLKRIEESARNLLALINDILDLSRIGAGKLELELDDIPFPKLIESTLVFIRQPALKRSIEVHCEYDPQVQLVRVDHRRLKQILVNLLSNAVKFTPDGGKIGIQVIGYPAENEISITVWDTGIGISPENQKKLFNPFVQLDSSLSRQYPGTGLGLSLTSRLVALHHGRISVQSTVGEGSRFVVHLPWKVAPQVTESLPDNSTQEPQRNSSSPSGSRILLVEDNEDNICLLSEYLESKGYEAVIARNGPDAISLARKSPPAIILMDIQMPGMDGFEAIQHIRASDNLKTVPIVALTGMAMPGDSQRCRTAGANEYLSKPYSLKALIEIIEGQIRVSSSPARQ
jgi:signal transduction histidine kinase/CheY-like chemotaxis protein